MIVDRIFTPSLAQVAYIVADDSSGEVAVIDPRRDIDAYLDWAKQRGYRIVAVFETHIHADFVSGGKELATATGATLYASDLGNQDAPHHPLSDGEEVKIGSLSIRALWTPGHTPEHMSYLLFDPAQGDDPYAVFTGDALFVGDVGRPDLLGTGHTQDLAKHLFQTITRRFAALPERTIVYPGHTAGSSCGKKIGDAPDSTIGQEQRTNYAFRLPTEAAFASNVMADMPPAPTYYPELKKVNKVGPTDIASLRVGGALTADAVKTAKAEGALVIDTRTPAAFGAGHIPGAIFVGWGSNFLTWMGWLAPYDQDMVFVLDDSGVFDDLQTELHRIGLERIRGFLDNGMTTWVEAGNPVETLSQQDVMTLAAHRDGSLPLPVLDVRGNDEFREGHIASAVNVFAGAIGQGSAIPFGKDEAFAVICGTGYRSSVAASLLQAQGFTHVINIPGGMTAWSEAMLPVGV